MILRHSERLTGENAHQNITKVPSLMRKPSVRVKHVKCSF
jgi:hypothetical protein